jgi:hypothetical protein
VWDQNVRWFLRLCKITKKKGVDESFIITEMCDYRDMTGITF